MKVPFGTFAVGDRSKALINKILDSGRVSSGRYVQEFEERFAAIAGTKWAVAVSSGADAVALSLAALYDRGAMRNDEIIVPALSFVATGNAVLQAGFKPVFVDIRAETLNINPDLIEDKVNRRTRAILAVHLMGKPAAMGIIKMIARKYSLAVIEDAAEAHGASINGRAVGSLGDMGAFSLYIAHIISTIEGGIITTNSSETAAVLRSLRSHGRMCDCRICVINRGKGICRKRFASHRDIRFIFERIGFSSKMNEIEAAVGLGSLDAYDRTVNTRRRNLLEMIRRLDSFSEYFFTIHQDRGEMLGPHAFPVILRKDLPFTRDQLTDYLNKKGVDTRDLFSSMPTQCNGFSFLGYKHGEFPAAEYIGTHGLHIGVHQGLRREHIDYVFSTLKSFIARHKSR
jgi:dTDP-4-amino-4,6-dideoxygalactose transaminase